jgi:hypothetical protein
LIHNGRGNVLTKKRKNLRALLHSAQGLHNGVPQAQANVTSSEAADEQEHATHEEAQDKHLRRARPLPHNLVLKGENQKPVRDGGAYPIKDA